MGERGLGRDALDHLDRALAAKPDRDPEALTAAVTALSGFRDDLIVKSRTREDPSVRRDLDHVNAVLSVVLAAEFPIGQVPWADLAAARGWLAAIVSNSGRQ